MTESSLIIIIPLFIVAIFAVYNWSYLSTINKIILPLFIYINSLCTGFFLLSYLHLGFYSTIILLGCISPVFFSILLSILVSKKRNGKKFLWLYIFLPALMSLFFYTYFRKYSISNLHELDERYELNSDSLRPKSYGTLQNTVGNSGIGASSPPQKQSKKAFYYWNNIDVLGQNNIKLKLVVDGSFYQGVNDFGNVSFKLPGKLENRNCLVYFSDGDKEELVPTFVGHAISIPKNLISNRSEDLLPKSKEDLGKLAYSIPDTMELGKWVTISIRITSDAGLVKNNRSEIPPPIAKGMTNEQVKNLKIKDLTIGTEMRAELQGLDNFEVKELTPRVQTIELSKNKFTEWVWEVKALKEGSAQLIASISLTKNINGKTLSKSIEVYRGEISVYARIDYTIWYGAFSGVLLFSILFYYWFSKRNKRTALVQPLSLWLNASVITPKSVFIGYAEEDQNWADKFYNYLLSFSKTGYVTIWYEKLILVGSDRMETIKKQLINSDVILFIISSDFLASPDCDELIKLSIERYNYNGVKIVPIVVRKCHWELTELKVFQPLPKNQKAISSEWNNSDEAIYQVIEELQALIVNQVHG